MTAQHEMLRGLIEPWLSAEHVELDDLELVGSGKGRTVRVLVDADGGVDIDRIAELSLGISALLDAEADFEDSYQLEVSSPGLERKLRAPRHYEKSIGREVSIKIRRDGSTEVLKGVLTSADDEGFRVEVEGVERSAAYDEVTSAKTVYRWEKAPKPGKQKSSGAPSRSPKPGEEQ